MNADARARELLGDAGLEAARELARKAPRPGQAVLDAITLMLRTGRVKPAAEAADVEADVEADDRRDDVA